MCENEPSTASLVGVGCPDVDIDMYEVRSGFDWTDLMMWSPDTLERERKTKRLHTQAPLTMGKQ